MYNTHSVLLELVKEELNYRSFQLCAYSIQQPLGFAKIHSDICTKVFKVYCINWSEDM